VSAWLQRTREQGEDLGEDVTGESEGTVVEAVKESAALIRETVAASVMPASTA